MTDLHATLAHETCEWLRQAAPSAQLSADSRRIAPGDAFFACPGDAGDGRDYIPQAIEAGARAVLFDPAGGFAWNDESSVAQRAVPGLPALAGYVAREWYGAPDGAMFSVAVTGTNGKTSGTQWLGQALSRAGLPTAVIGTLGVGLYEKGACGSFAATGYTTPDAVQLHRSLAQMRGRGATALAIEASSIGLDQGRMNGVHVDVAVFTNLTRDHLDYHGDMAAYEAAKMRLFDWPGLRHAVVNLDDETGLRVAAHLRARRPEVGVIGYSLLGAAVDGVQAVQAHEIRLGQQGTTFHLASPFGGGNVRSQTIGRFNVGNLLAVAGVLFARGMEWTAVQAQLEALLPVPGRMQQLGGVDAPLVVVDYAHTPDALEKALQTLREVADERHGRLWCVFGCGGDRDPGKRPHMGAAGLAADHLVVTSDNPRGEEPAAIIAQVMAGIPERDVGRVQVIEDRANAILHAVRHSGKNDVVLVAGKGHEATQEVKGRKLAFLDADHASLALATRATRFGGH